MKQLVLFVFLSLLMASPVQAEKPATIGYVNLQEIIDKSKPGQEARRALEKKFGDKQEEFTKEKQEILQLQETLDRDKVLMSQEELDKKTAEIRKRKEEFQKKATQFQQELAKEENESTNRILKPTPAIIAAVAKDKQIAVVFERRQSGLLYINEGLDITAEVIKRLDAQEKKK